MSAHYDPGKLENIQQKVIEALEQFTADMSADLQGNLQENSPVNHGRLQGSWNRRRTDQFLYETYSNVEYALPVSEGSDPHEILPDGEFLAFEWPDAPSEVQEMFPATFPLVFFRSVQHPGYEGTGYIDESIQQTTGRVDDFISRALDKAGL